MKPELEFNEIVPSELENVVAAEPLNNGSAVLYLRDGENVNSRVIPFNPFILAVDPEIMNGCEMDFDVTALEGAAYFAYRIDFTNLEDYKKALRFLRDGTGYGRGSPQAPYRVLSDLAQQLLTSKRIRLFRGMNFEGIRRMQVDIETLTTEGFEFPNPAREGDMISLISISDNTGWERSLLLKDPSSEKELLRNFVETVKERDPDVIEGHNIFRFDLSFIETRARRHKVKLALGRDGSLMRKRSSRFAVAERMISYPRFDIHGRHIVDTLHLTQLYDVTSRELADYNLKSVALHFSISPKNRTYVDGDELSDLYRQDPQRLAAYGLDDVRETKALAEILSPSYFYQAQLVPLSYQNSVLRGNATRIDAMLVGAYLEKGHSIPAPEKARPFAGGLTKALESGVFEDVWHCDVRSLYPSIILAEHWRPSKDALEVFPFFLDRLREFRLSAKDAERNAGSGEYARHYRNLQTTFKILINSFYGYLGFSQATFNDMRMAEKVTSRGRKILTTMLEFLQKEGAKVIEMDTDGLYFQAPDGVDSTDEMQKKIQSCLPEGIEVELDETYRAMFCYKAKNYAVLKNDGEIGITGAALKSRGLEPFQREFMKDFIRLLLQEDFKGLGKLVGKYRDAIVNRSWPLAKFAKTETLQDSPESYKRKISSGKGRRSAAYELALGSDRDYRQGDQISYYVTGDKKKCPVVDNAVLLADAPEKRDENTAYYLGKFEDLYKKFSQFLPEEKLKKQQGELDFG